MVVRLGAYPCIVKLSTPYYWNNESYGLSNRKMTRVDRWIAAIHRKRLFTLTLVSIVTFSALSLTGFTLMGHGIIDQQCSRTIASGRGTYTGGIARVGQFFIPARTVLTGVSVYIATFGSAPQPLTVAIRDGGLDGSVATSVNSSVPTSFQSPALGWFHVLFANPLTLILDNTYAIELGPPFNLAIDWGECLDRYSGASYVVGLAKYPSYRGINNSTAFAFMTYAGDYPSELVLAVNGLGRVAISVVAGLTALGTLHILYRMGRQRRLDYWKP